MTQQACLEEAKALLADVAQALSVAQLLSAQRSSDDASRIAAIALTKRRAEIFHKRAMTRLQEAFYSDDEVPGA